MERAEEDLATSPAKWQRLLSCRLLEHEVVVIPLPSVCKGTALEKLERGPLSSPVLSGWFLPLRPACVLFAPVLCVGLNKGYI